MRDSIELINQEIIIKEKPYIIKGFFLTPFSKLYISLYDISSKCTINWDYNDILPIFKIWFNTEDIK